VTAINLFELVIGPARRAQAARQGHRDAAHAGRCQDPRIAARSAQGRQARQAAGGQNDIAGLDLLILWNVGAVYPMLRTHTLLSALHAHMQDKPLVMFYPGKYDGYSLRLFSRLKDDHYYRAFRLVS
jgi:hypothetical protein